MKRIGSCATLAALAVGILAPPAWGQSVTRLYTLGDSLSDAGTYAPSTQLVAPGSGRFTTNPGLVWTEYLGMSLGLTNAPAIGNQGFAPTRTPLGGTNYAQGGARVALPNTPDAFAFVTQDAVSTQVDRLLADTGGRIEAKASLTVWAGANDVLFASAAVGGATRSVSDALGDMSIAAASLAAQVRRLQAAGAKLVVINTVPDLGRTPLGTSLGPDGAALLSALTAQFNAQLLLSTQGQNVLVFDANKLLNDFQARPAAYGLTSPTALTVPVCSGSSLTCVNPAGADISLFADAVHPTAATHRLISEATQSVLRAPAQLSALAVSPLLAIRQHSQVLEPRLSSIALVAPTADGRLALRRVGHLEMYTDAEVGRFRSDSADPVQPASRSKTGVLALGGDVQVLPNALVGAVLAQAKGSLDFAGNAGGFDSRLTSLALYGTAALSERWFVSGSAGAASLAFDDIHRDARLGASGLRVRSTGDTSGRYAAWRVGGGYVMQHGSFVGGPTLSYTNESVRVKGYAEDAGPLSLVFGETRFKAKRLSLGMNAGWDLGRIQLFGRVSLETDLNRDPLRLSIGSFAGNMLTVDGDRPDANYAMATVGVRGHVSRGVYWSLAYSTTLRQRNIKGQSIGATLQVALD